MISFDNMFQSPTNRVLNSVGMGQDGPPARKSVVSIPYKSGPKFCGGCVKPLPTPVVSGFNPLQIGS